MLESLADKFFSRETLEIRVAMLGPRRAGKTSMLSAMFERFENALMAERIADLMALSADTKTAAALAANYSELIRIINEGGNVAGAITGDSEAHSYGFDLKRSPSSKDVQIRLSFQDYPGGWLMAGLRNPAEPQYRTVVDYVRNAHVLLAAVDTPYLMEENGRWHERRNMPGHVAATVKAAWRENDDTPRMVILVPIKCEKYDSDKVARAALVEATRSGYSELIDYLDTLPRCAVLCAPAQTTGCVNFDHFAPMQPGDELPAPVFSMPEKFEDRAYRPKDCSQTLRYCLVYALQRYDKEGGVGLGGRIRKILKLDRKFKEGAEVLAAGCHGTFFRTMRKS